MKKNSFAILIFILFSELQNSSAQSYHPFPDTLAQWSEVGAFCPFWDPGDLCSTYNWLFSLGHDTIIDKKEYTLVGYNVTAYSTWILGGQTVSIENYPYQLPGEIFGAIREDSDKKVWYRKLKEISQPVFSAAYIGSRDSDVLLYDFNVAIGDTLAWKQDDYIVVQSIDSFQLIDGEWRRKIVFNSLYGDDDFWIEGMGSNLGLFGAYQRPPFEGGDKLSCFEQNEILLYSPYTWDSTFECNKIYTQISELKESNLISAFPNPARDFIIFDLHKFSSEKCIVTIYDLNGKQVQRFKCSPSSPIKIPVSEIGSDGLYFYTVKVNEETLFRGKFLIQH